MNKKISSLLVGMCLLVPCSILAGCDNSDPEVKHTEHTFVSEWTIDDTHHWHKCESCTEVDSKGEHNWDDGVVLVPETGHTDGSRLLICEDCKVSTVVAIPKNTTLVTADEWQSALSFVNVNDFKMSDDKGLLFVIDGDKSYAKGEEAETYAAIENQKYVSYTKVFGTWSKQEIDESAYNTIRDYSFVTNVCSLFNFEDFEYNATTKAYEAENLTILGNTIDKVQLFFDNQRCIKVFSAKGSESQLMMFDYGDQTVTLPNNLVTSEEWQSAFGFDYDTYQMNMYTNDNGEPGEVIFKKNHDLKHMDGMGVLQYINIESGKYYLYDFGQDGWVKEEISESEYYEMSVTKSFEGFVSSTMFEKFTFDENTGAYKADDIQIGSTLITTMSVYFENGKIVRIVVSMVNNGTDLAADANFTYADETLSLPSEYTTLPSTFVTLEEMDVALDFLNVENFQLEMGVDGSDEKIISKKYGDIEYLIYGNNKEFYACIEDGVCYAYTKDGIWTKEEVTVTNYRQINLAYHFFSYFDLSYIKENMSYNTAYECYEINDIVFDGEDVDTMRLYFSDQKLVKVEMYSVEGVMKLDFAYNDEEIVLPDLTVSQVSEHQWCSALDFMDSYTRYQLEIEGGESGEFIIDDTKVYCIDGDGSENYWSVEGGNYYEYSNYTGEWVKSLIDQDRYEEMRKPIDLENLANSAGFAKFTYNPTTAAYEAENLDMFDNDILYDKVSFVFNQGRLERMIIVYQGLEAAINIYYDIGVVVTLPTVGQ